uniref:Cytosolic beta-glucosidase n=1 Tax=Poecilia latipinna TaxID=48699 RepID=A0A3B3VMZ3_9TELE
MQPRCGVSVCHVLMLVLCLSAAEDFDWTKNNHGSFYYGTFPTFSWGAGGSAYQTEGAWDKDGKGLSIWDVFSHKKGKIQLNDTGDSSCESYYKIKDDISLMKEIRLNHYRFSISWPRIIPTGVKDHVNGKGIQYYDELINHLLENHITPIVTLYHWDLPQQVLQEKYGGWQNISMVNHFNDFANLCFEKYGDRVKHWITFNNPWSVAVEGYETGEHAPGLKLRGTGAYRAAHHIIKAHAKVWHTYDTQWRGKQKLVGISLSGDWGEPVDISNQKDIEAAERYVQFYLGWFATPIFHGDYPQVMKDFVRKSVQQGLGTSRLPAFSSQEKSYIKGTCDFLGIGHFTTRYITHRNDPTGRSSNSYFTDRDLAELVDPRWPDPGSEWLYSVPWGFRRLLNFVKTQYGNPMIYVTENGVSEKMMCTELCDEWRIQYYKDYINEMLKAIRDGVNVKGYTAWSLLDKFEWDEGYSERFGLYYVDFRNKNKPRYPKASVQFYKRIISSNGFPNQREVENWRRKAVEMCSSSNQLLAAEQRSTAANILRLIHPLTSHMEMVTEIVVPTVCTLSILISAVLLMFLLRRRN